MKRLAAALAILAALAFAPSASAFTTPSGREICPSNKSHHPHLRVCFIDPIKHK